MKVNFCDICNKYVEKTKHIGLVNICRKCCTGGDVKWVE